MESPTALSKWIDNIRKTEDIEGPGFRRLGDEQSLREKIEEFWIEREDMLAAASKSCGSEIKRSAFKGWTRVGFPSTHVRQLGQGKGAIGYFPKAYIQWVADIQGRKRQRGVSLEEAILAGKSKVIDSICDETSKDLKTLITYENADIFEKKRDLINNVSVLLEQGVKENQKAINTYIKDLLILEQESVQILRNGDVKNRPQTLSELRKHKERLIRRIKAYLYVLEEILGFSSWNRLAWTVGLIDKRSNMKPDEWAKEIEVTAELLMKKDISGLMAT